MVDFNARTCPKKKKEIKFSQKNYRQNMFEEDKQKRNEDMKECRKNQYNNALEKLKENDGFIQMMMMTPKKIVSLEINKMRVASNKLLI